MDEMNTFGKPKRGGQPGNQNARKYGFYSSALDRTQKNYLVQASPPLGLIDEINLVRVKLKAVAKRDPYNTSMIMQLSDTLVRLTRAHHKMHGNSGIDIQTAVSNVIREIGMPMGLLEVGQRMEADWEKEYLAKLKKEHKQIVDIPAQPDP